MQTKHTPLQHTQDCVTLVSWQSLKPTANSTVLPTRTPAALKTAGELSNSAACVERHKSVETRKEFGAKLLRHTVQNVNAAENQSLGSLPLTTPAEEAQNIAVKDFADGDSTSGSKNTNIQKMGLGCFASTATVQEVNTVNVRMKNNFTPGPWKFHVGRGIDPRWHVQTTGGLQIVETPKNGCACGRDDVNEANARLIAAAPELLEALAGLIQCRDGTFATTDRRWAESMVEARSAIAKATGKESQT